MLNPIIRRPSIICTKWFNVSTIAGQYYNDTSDITEDCYDEERPVHPQPKTYSRVELKKKSVTRAYGHSRCVKRVHGR